MKRIATSLTLVTPPLFVLSLALAQPVSAASADAGAAIPWGSSWGGTARGVVGSASGTVEVVFGECTGSACTAGPSVREIPILSAPPSLETGLGEGRAGPPRGAGLLRFPRLRIEVTPCHGLVQTNGPLLHTQLSTDVSPIEDIPLATDSLQPTQLPTAVASADDIPQATGSLQPTQLPTEVTPTEGNPRGTDPLQPIQLPIDVTPANDIPQATDSLLMLVPSAIPRTGDFPAVPVPMQLTQDLITRAGEFARVSRKLAEMPADIAQARDVAQMDVTQPTTEVARPGNLPRAAQSLAAFPGGIARGEGSGSASSIPRVARELLRLLDLVQQIPLPLAR